MIWAQNATPGHIGPLGPRESSLVPRGLCELRPAVASSGFGCAWQGTEFGLKPEPRFTL